jgi:protein-disulfide isomerase
MKMRQWLIAAVAVAILAAGGGAYWAGQKPAEQTGVIATEAAAEPPAALQAARDEKLPNAEENSTPTDPRLADRVLGKSDAPVTIIEYASLTCGHCAHFHQETFDKLKEAYIDTGKVRFIFREFPLDGVALKASAIARCMPSENYHAFISMLMKNQQQWTQGQDPIQNVIQYAKLGGLSEVVAKACTEDKTLLDGVVAIRTAGEEKYQIQATPTFIINDGADRLAGAQNLEALAAKIDPLLATTPAQPTVKP